MTSISDVPSVGELEVEKRATNAIIFALGVAGVSLLLGAGLYYTWNWGFASLFTFLKPISSYWTAVLAVLGLYIVLATVKSAWNMMAYKVLDTGRVLDEAMPVAVLLGLAYLFHLLA
ncbi:MAG TPA: hypothetical protein VFW52_01120 [Candidatus Saccharimonadales bacterium]|nr:hypothetical protein [Candidatus Saccharimonadales bacterium]